MALTVLSPVADVLSTFGVFSNGLFKGMSSQIQDTIADVGLNFYI